nr:MAG TPA: crystallin beta/gamma motif-containing protein [Caudoviricetes sp.]
MAFYTENPIEDIHAPLTLDDTEVTFGDYLGAAVGDAWSDNPVVSSSRGAHVNNLLYGVDQISDLVTQAEEGGLTGLDDLVPLQTDTPLSVDDQKELIKAEGLEGHIKPQEGYNAEALNYVMQLKHEELDRALTREQAPAWMAPFGFGAGLVTSMLDPINVASSFIPIVGEQRVMSMLARNAGSAWGRAGVRVGVGALEGAVGVAALEPLIYAAKTQTQSDYGMTDSLLNIAFGTVMGGAMHGAGGAWGDWVRKRRGIRQPWEIVTPTDVTESLRRDFAERMYAAAREAGSGITREQADAAAILFDARARTWAYDTGQGADRYYENPEWNPVFRAARDAEETAQIEEIASDLNGIRAEDEAAAQPEAEPAAVVEETEPAAVEPADADVAPVMEEEPDGHHRVRGLDTSILNGQAEELAYYELREMSDLIPSHDPETQFAKRTDYPEGVQERPYHSDSGEQEKVLRNAATLDPRYLLNDNPDAVNGPPLVTESGIVLGGNSRTMSMQLAYGRFPERAEGYRNALRQRAALFGLDPAAVDTFERPVLVRVVPGGENVADMAVRSRLYNQSQTQGLQAKAEGVSKARLLTVETMDTLATDMEDFDSLREFLASVKSKDFINALVRDGVIEQTQLSRLTDASGKLNDAGKDLVENALRGHIVPDYDVLNATPPAVLNKLDRAIPALARLKARGEGWDMSGVVTRALRVIASADAEGKDIGIYLGQGDLFQSGPKPAVQALALTFSNATQKEVQLRFTVLADAAEKQARGQTSLFVQTGNTPAREFVRAFMEPVASVDGEAVPSFNPTKNTEHAAIQYAYDHGGKGHSVSTALEDLQKKLSGKKTPAEEKARARELMGELGQFSGAVNIYEPKLGQFFSYRKGDELFQGQARGTQTPIVVRGDELGVPEGAEIKEYIAAAKKYHDALRYESEHGKPVTQPQLERPVRFSGKGWKKNTYGGANPDKWKLFTKLREIIETSTLKHTEEVNKPRKDGFTRFHWVENFVELDGKPRRVGLMLAEDKDGNLFYNLNADVASRSQKSGSSNLPGHSIPGESEPLSQSATAPVEARIPVSDDGVNLYILSEAETAEEPRARVTFGAEDGRAVIEFFKSADVTSAPHELYHIFRREIEQTAKAEGASERSKQMWRRIEEFVGAEPGQAWTREMEEKFARAGERFLLEGVAPSPALESVFARLKQWFMEIYTNADAAGLEISDGMRQVFGDMLALSPEESDIAFRYGLGLLLQHDPADDVDTNIEVPLDNGDAAQALSELAVDSEQRANEAYATMEASHPEEAAAIQKEYVDVMSNFDVEAARAAEDAEILMQAALCDFGR